MNQFNTGISFAKEQDALDPLKNFRDQFHFPKIDGKETLYFTGNSLGLQPKITEKYIKEELDAWKNLGVEGHFHGKRPWMHYHKFTKNHLAAVVGARPSEVVSMGSLTSNLHQLMVSFYRPSKKRFKIIVEAGAFPSDQYLFETQLKFHGIDPKEGLIELQPEKGKEILSTKSILASIKANQSELALVLIGGVQYYTGQLFDIESITRAGHEAGAMVGFDLAHAAGNVPLQLHEHGVDFAAWCTYKYLNAGPGSVAAIFVHEKHGENFDLPRFGGWWGNKEDERFLMKKGFQPMTGADGWQMSNVNVLPSAALLASLELFHQVGGMAPLREKSLKLTAYMEWLIDNWINDEKALVDIITPRDPKQRGAQLSLVMNQEGKKVFKALNNANVIADWREPNVIRVAPVPMYNSFQDVFTFCAILKNTLSS